MSVYGHARPTTPAAEALASAAVRFDNAYVTAPWTQPSTASIMTGLFPSAHGVRATFSALSAVGQTLAGVFQAAGYRTEGIVSNRLLGRRYGFDSGFDRYSERHVTNHQGISTPGVTREAVRRLRVLAEQTEPFFLFVHYFDPHFDYLPHPDYSFASARTALTGGRSILSLRDMGTKISNDEVEYVRDLYDGEVRFTDDGVSELLRALDALNLAEDTVVALTADHGEELFERGWVGHARSLHREVVRVPLLIRAPGVPPGIVQQPVSLVSLATTLAELAGIPNQWHGTGVSSLTPLLTSPDAGYDTPVYMEVAFREHPESASTQDALVVDGWKIIQDLDSGQVRFYDLRIDPLEFDDLAGVRPSVRDVLLPLLFAARESAALGTFGDATEAILDEAERERLRALGYIR